MHDDLITLLVEQGQCYPSLQIQDAVKLIYQQEFGPGHMVNNTEESLKRLEEEFLHLDAKPPSQLFEDIGNGLCRLHLAASIGQSIDLSTINSFFCYTANTHKGTMPVFAEKLSVFAASSEEGVLPFSGLAVADFIEEYRRSGYPPVGHSAEYRCMHRPAYRVVKALFRDYFPLFSRIDALRKTSNPIFVAIDGMSCAGKSSLAALLGSIYGCNVISIDDFFLPKEMKTPARLAEPGGNIHHERFSQQVSVKLKQGIPFSYQPFDCKKQDLSMPIEILPNSVNIIEGVYSLHPGLSLDYHLKVFLETNPDEQSRRCLARNGPEMHRRFIGEWIPMENHYFRETQVKSKCDLVFAPKFY